MFGVVEGIACVVCGKVTPAEKPVCFRHVVTDVALTDEVLTWVIDDAGTGYWQSAGKYDVEARTLEVVCEDPDAEGILRKTLTFDELIDGLTKLVDGRVKVNSEIREMARSVLFEEDADYDADLGDCMIQAALFNDIVFG